MLSKILDVFNNLFNLVGWVKGYFDRREEHTDKKRRADAEAGLRVEKQKQQNKKAFEQLEKDKELSDEEWLDKQS